ncbi:MAG: hypothetical protein QM719_03245 [Thermomonas sp.]
MRRLVILVLAMFAFAAHATTKVELLDTFPSSGSDIVVPPGDNVYLRIGYDTDTPVHIWARPYFQGKEVAAGSSPSLEYSGKGELLGFFFLNPPGGQVDEIRVTAGDGSRKGTPEIARFPLRAYSYAGAHALPAEPEWVVSMRDAQNKAMNDAFKAQANKPVSGGDVAIFGGFMLAFAALGLLGLGWPAWALWRWRDKWRLWAAIPLAVVGFVVLRIAVGVSRDPTSHNLWPFEILMAGGCSVVAMTAISVLRWLQRRGSA